MPELPEVETTLRGIRPFVLQQEIAEVILYQTRLRWPIPSHLPAILKKQTILAIKRRAKYLLFETKIGTLILHLGMSGSLRLVTADEILPRKKHDHVEFLLANGTLLRFNDPRRFGAILWTSEKSTQHKLLASLGPEPLTRAFSLDYVWKITRNKTTPAKIFIMNNKNVVGVGNIYAAESLFAAGIDPRKPVNELTYLQCQKWVIAIKKILRAAIRQGGTTLKDFVDGHGKPGYFRMRLKVYGRAGEGCFSCGKQLKLLSIGQRSTVYCACCQK